MDINYNKYKHKYFKLKQELTGGSGYNSDMIIDEMNIFLQYANNLISLSSEFEFNHIVNLLPEQYCNLLLIMLSENRVTEARQYNKIPHYIDFIRILCKINIKHYNKISPLYNHYYTDNQSLLLATYNIYNDQCNLLKPLKDEIFSNKIVCCQEAFNEEIFAISDEFYQYIDTHELPIDTDYVFYLQNDNNINISSVGLNSDYEFNSDSSLHIDGCYPITKFFPNHPNIIIFGAKYNALAVLLPKHIKYEEITGCNGTAFKSLQTNDYKYSLSFKYKNHTITNIHLDGGKFVDETIAKCIAGKHTLEISELPANDLSTYITYIVDVILKKTNLQSALNHLKETIIYILYIKMSPLLKAVTIKSTIILGDFNSVFSTDETQYNSKYTKYLDNLHKRFCNDKGDITLDTFIKCMFIINMVPYYYLQNNGYTTKSAKTNESAPKTPTSPFGDLIVDMIWIKESLLVDSTYHDYHCFVKKLGLTKNNSEVFSNIGSKHNNRCTSDHYPVFLNYCDNHNDHTPIDDIDHISSTQLNTYINSLLRKKNNIMFRGTCGLNDDKGYRNNNTYISKSRIHMRDTNNITSIIEHSMNTKFNTPYISVTPNIKQALFFTYGRGIIGEEKSIIIIKVDEDKNKIIDPLIIIDLLNKYTNYKFQDIIENHVKYLNDSLLCDDTKILDNFGTTAPPEFQQLIQNILTQIQISKNTKLNFDSFINELITKNFIIGNLKDKNFKYLDEKLALYIFRVLTQSEKLIQDKLTYDRLINFYVDSYDLEGRYILNSNSKYKLLCNSWSHTDISLNYMHALCNIALFNIEDDNTTDSTGIGSRSNSTDSSFTTLPIIGINEINRMLPGSSLQTSKVQSTKDPAIVPVKPSDKTLALTKANELGKGVGMGKGASKGVGKNQPMKQPTGQPTGQPIRQPIRQTTGLLTGQPAAYPLPPGQQFQQPFTSRLV